MCPADSSPRRSRCRRAVVGWPSTSPGAGRSMPSSTADGLGLEVAPEGLGRLIDLGREVKAALAGHPQTAHPVDERLSGVYGTIFVNRLARRTPVRCTSAMSRSSPTVRSTARRAVPAQPPASPRCVPQASSGRGRRSSTSRSSARASLPGYSRTQPRGSSRSSQAPRTGSRARASRSIRVIPSCPGSC
jgi:hypothetical protein